MERFSTIKVRKIIDEDDATHYRAGNPHPARGGHWTAGGGHLPQAQHKLPELLVLEKLLADQML